jgi:lipopolysaccharide/colanic/teichoic acid biosynthesis glycosyltransferase
MKVDLSFSNMLKRIFDFLLALTGLFISLPLWLILSMVIRIEDGAEVFYFQERVGKHGRIFKSWKFRSMIPGAENGLGPVRAQSNDLRVTKIGRLMRKTAMDELPQLLNILKGEMSFVGPRALRPVEIDADSFSEVISIFQVPGFEKRSSIQPGLTGAAQVFASRKLSLEEKFKYDLWYVDNKSFWLDIRLILKSFLTTFRGKWDT